MASEIFSNPFIIVLFCIYTVSVIATVVILVFMYINYKNNPITNITFIMLISRLLLVITYGITLIPKATESLCLIQTYLLIVFDYSVFTSILLYAILFNYLSVTLNQREDDNDSVNFNELSSTGKDKSTRYIFIKNHYFIIYLIIMTVILIYAAFYYYFGTVEISYKEFCNVGGKFRLVNDIFDHIYLISIQINFILCIIRMKRFLSRKGDISHEYKDKIELWIKQSIILAICSLLYISPFIIDIYTSNIQKKSKIFVCALEIWYTFDNIYVIIIIVVNKFMSSKEEEEEELYFDNKELREKSDDL